ncbi:hypothetical protein B0H12DRAFT_626044 [Mycena haematopus]|nr:hypothetical protein B0H12DRAFT_626044 [Mycena haematopus]
MPATDFDLNQVGKLFDDAIAAIRDGAPARNAMEPQALRWLKAARHKLMRELQQIYYQLEGTHMNTGSHPSWAVDPAQPLSLFIGVPAVLEPYRSVMGDNLNSLLKDCGFQSRLSCSTAGKIWFYINFPTQVATAPAPQVPGTLHVEDEFSTQTKPGAVAENPFARLITTARASASDGIDSGGNIGHRLEFKYKAREEATGTFESIPDAGIAPAQSNVAEEKQPEKQSWEAKLLLGIFWALVSLIVIAYVFEIVALWVNSCIDAKLDSYYWKHYLDRHKY